MAQRSKRHVAFVAALLAGSSLAAVEMAQAQQGPFVYVPNVGSNNVSVIDTSTNTTVPPAIAVGTNPQTAAARGDESLVYVTNPTSNTVSVINTGTNAVTATISGLNNPAGIAVSPDGTRAYVTDFGNNTVAVIRWAVSPSEIPPSLSRSVPMAPAPLWSTMAAPRFPSSIRPTAQWSPSSPSGAPHKRSRSVQMASAPM
jgi:YVTN family beta-propeller protein